MLTGYLKNALSSLKRLKLRAVLTSLSVSVGVFSVVIISIISSIGIDSIESSLSQMGMDNLVVSGSRNNLNGLNTDDLQIIKSQSNVINAMPLMYRVTICETENSECECMVWGVNEDANEVIELEVVYGRLLNKGDIIGSSRVCIIDQELAMLHFSRTNVVGKTITAKLNGSYFEYEIVGVVKNGVNMLQSMLGNIIPNFIYIPYTSMQEVTNQQYFNEIAVKTNGNSQKVCELIENSIALNKADPLTLSVENLVAQKDRLSEIFKYVSIILALIAGISLIVSGLSIMTIMTISVNERTKEIGIKKSIGAKAHDILSEFMLEAIIISLFGAIVGAFSGIICAIIGGFALDLHIGINFAIIGATIAFSVIIAVIFSIFPALKASRLKIADALRRD